MKKASDGTMIWTLLIAPAFDMSSGTEVAKRPA